MKRINLKDAWKQLDELKTAQGVKESITLIIASPEDDERIRAVIHRGRPTSGKHGVEYFNSMDELTTLPGINENTLLIWDDVDQ